MSQFSGNGFQYESAIKAEEPSIIGWIVRGIVGAVMSGLLSGLLWATIIIFVEGWMGLKTLTMLGIIMGFLIGIITASLAGRKSTLVGIIAILGCGIAIIVGKYTLLYWYSRDLVGSPFNPDLMQYLVSTVELWGIEDLVWFVATAFSAWFLSARPTAPAASSQT